MYTDMNLSENNRDKVKQAFRLIMLVFVVCTLFVTVFVCLITYFYGVDAMAAGHQAAKPYLVLWRLFIFMVIIGGWNRWMKWLAQWADLTPQQHQFNLQYRWRFALWLIVFEALLVQNILAIFVDIF
jgi:hypothetical protein